jgi:hypothetical protein
MWDRVHFAAMVTIRMVDLIVVRSLNAGRVKLASVRNIEEFCALPKPSIAELSKPGSARCDDVLGEHAPARVVDRDPLTALSGEGPHGRRALRRGIEASNQAWLFLLKVTLVGRHPLDPATVV